jgi:hypothetical protein
MDPRRFLEVAQFFANTASSTSIAVPGYRTAISRSYYALYGVVCELLDHVRISIIEPKRGHDAAKQVLGFCTDPDAKRVSEDLKTLLGQRWAADYDMADTAIATQNTAKACVEQARLAIEQLDGIRKSPPVLSALTDKMSGLKVIRVKA